MKLKRHALDPARVVLVMMQRLVPAFRELVTEPTLLKKTGNMHTTRMLTLISLHLMRGRLACSNSQTTTLAGFLLMVALYF